MLALLLFACGETDKNAGETADVPTESHMSVDDFENVDCHDYQGTPTNSAATYYVGNFLLDEGSSTISGIESAFFIASETLSELPEWEAGSCEMHWVVSGDVTDPQGCASCDIAFSLQASLSAPDSNCPEDLQEGFESMELFYNIERADDGTSTWYMESGTYLGQGTHLDNGTITYVSDEDCKRF